MIYKLRLSLYLQPLRQPQHKQYTCTRMLELRDYEIRNTCSKGILDCSGARTSKCTKGPRKQRRVPPHEQPRGLERKSRCKNSWARFSPRALHINRAVWVLLQGKGITPRMFESMALVRRVLHLDSSQGLYQQRDAGLSL